eukprot:CAMPEP_0202355268 /NCGR_PEP_ID=MMETSP1126-20121109/10238_1 /ASSEMBLY_ACC=CAM_ASM_000457 /TAXON_ID=3047 /ORGANISM="Dunaliella tertiolecta, Strain CCMP1320" /LENGTH=161 /DNA_ID=CAMNT_0048947865 /DNA_START=809 /DNA_END=1295 /DNA_ORIENTATION=-
MSTTKSAAASTPRPCTPASTSCVCSDVFSSSARLQPPSLSGGKPLSCFRERATTSSPAAASASKAGAWRLAKRALVPVRPPAAAGAGETWHATTAVSKVTWHATAELEGCPPCAAPGAPPAMDAAAPAALAEASLLPAGGGAAAQWTADHPLPGEGAPPPP